MENKELDLRGAIFKEPLRAGEMNQPLRMFNAPEDLFDFQDRLESSCLPVITVAGDLMPSVLHEYLYTCAMNTEKHINKT